MSDRETHRRWQPQEWQKVAAGAVRPLSKGKDLLSALLAGQRLLPPDRRRNEEEMQGILYQAATKRYIAEAQALSPEALAEIAPPPAPRKPPPPRERLDEGRDYASETRGLIRWTTKEKARIARQVLQWQRAGDTRTLTRLIIEAQELVLDPDRRRPLGSIQAGVGPGHNARMLAEGTANIWLIEADEKRAREAAAAAAPPAVADVPVEAPAAIPAAAAPAERPAETPSAPATAPEPVSAPAPTSRANPLLSAAAQAFGETVMGALDKLLRVHAETVLGAVNARMAALSSQTSLEIAAMIEQSMRRTVHTMVEAELGGPIAAPDSPAPIPPPAESAPPEQAQAVSAPREEAPPVETARAPSLKVDVVGLNNGALEQQVRQAFNGNTDFRFVNPDTGSGYAPHRGRHCIIATHRVPHALKDKIKAAKVEPLYVKSTVGHIIHAVEELHRATGIEMH